jgi:glycosyltransferase involved in cell wall biosynthesis
VSGGGIKRPRVLMVGTVNSVHIEHLAVDLAPELGAVTVAGWASPLMPQPRMLPGVRTVLIPRRALSRVGPPFRLIWLARLIRRMRPDVVHVHGATEFASGAALLRATPLLVTCWGSDVLAVEGRARARAAYALRRADAVTGDSPHLLERAVALGADQAQAHQIGWGVDLQRFGPVPGGRRGARQRLGLPPSGRLIVSPRALKALYNPEVVFAAFDRLADADPQVRLLVKHLGSDAPPQPPSRHADRVHVIGHVPYEQLPDVYAAADACISIPDTDSAPRTVWEAMACGTPCVLSDLPWLQGTVRARDEALVVRVDAEAVAAALTSVLADERLAEAVAANARALVERDQDARVHRQCWLELYAKLATERTR